MGGLLKKLIKKSVDVAPVKKLIKKSVDVAPVKKLIKKSVSVAPIKSIVKKAGSLDPTGIVKKAVSTDPIMSGLVKNGASTPTKTLPTNPTAQPNPDPVTKPVAPPSAGDGKMTIPKGETSGSKIGLPGGGLNSEPIAPTPPGGAPTPPPIPQETDLGPDITPAETSVEKRMNGLLRKDNAYMQGAEAAGMRDARRRGLGSSSMAVQASQAARINAALPIASQDASQSNTQLMQQRDIRSREMLSRLDRDAQDRVAKMNVAASERTAASQLAAGFESSYSATMAAIMSNPDLPSSARKAYTKHAGLVRDSNLRLVEQMYGIQLDWGAKGGGKGSVGTPGAGDLSDKEARAEAKRLLGDKVEEDEAWTKINDPLGLGKGYKGKKKPKTKDLILDPAGWFK